MFYCLDKNLYCQIEPNLSPKTKSRTQTRAYASDGGDRSKTNINLDKVEQTSF